MSAAARGLSTILDDAEAERLALQTEVAGLKLKCNLLSSKLEGKSSHVSDDGTTFRDAWDGNRGLLQRIPSLEKEVEVLRLQMSRSSAEASDLLSTATSEGTKPSFAVSESLSSSFPNVEELKRRLESQELAYTRAQVERDASLAKAERDRADLMALASDADSRCSKLGTAAREAEQGRALIAEQFLRLQAHCRTLHDTTCEVFRLLRAECQKCEKLKTLARVQSGQKDDAQSMYEIAMSELDQQQVDALDTKFRALQDEYFEGFASSNRVSAEASEEAIQIRIASENELASMQEQLSTLREAPEQDDIFFAAMQELLSRVESFLESGGTRRSLCSSDWYSLQSSENRYTLQSRFGYLGLPPREAQTVDAETQCSLPTTKATTTPGNFGPLSFLLCGSREGGRQQPSQQLNLSS